ncbi:hypothetical protein L1987_84572 [Smallanthus sonchifolius]|uniref:Uncharacterized protein n=1 Tax=Smallanthus sonchifolius TaxID=185202 RepID=A0ACB8YGM4_9ASTR|nr:hypothetical protein L1987_84572 [Smallanthus sonchifolius]
MWPDCGISMVSNGKLKPIPPMLVSNNLLLLNVVGLWSFFFWMDNWFWDFSRVNWVERDWLERFNALKILNWVTFLHYLNWLLSGGGYHHHWAGLERVRLPHIYTFSSVERSICEVGSNKCYCGVGNGMGWNMYTSGLIDIPRLWRRLWKCGWAEKSSVKNGLFSDKIEFIGPVFLLCINNQEPNSSSGRLLWPNNLARVGPFSHLDSWCRAFKFVAVIEAPRLEHRGIRPNWLATELWRLMELDLIHTLGWVDKKRYHQLRVKARSFCLGRPHFVRSLCYVNILMVYLYMYVSLCFASGCIRDPPRVQQHPSTRKTKDGKKDTSKKGDDYASSNKENCPVFDNRDAGTLIEGDDLHGEDREEEGEHNSQPVEETDVLVNMGNSMHGVMNGSSVAQLSWEKARKDPASDGAGKAGVDVKLNQEYVGDSILDNLSCSDSHAVRIMGTGEEKEVNSDQSNKQKTVFLDEMEDSLHVPHLYMQDIEWNDLSGAWENLMGNPRPIVWPDVWGDDCTEKDPHDGNTRFEIIWKAKGMEDDRPNINPSEIQKLVGAHSQNTKVNFFGDNDPIVASLGKWMDSLLGCKGDHKEKDSTSMDVVNIAEQSDDEELMALSQGDEDMTNGAKNLKKYRIWSSKNRKPEKNLSLKKVAFNNASIPPAQHLLGFSKFQLGYEKKPKSKSTTVTLARSGKELVGEFYKNAASNEARLSETTRNIIATNDKSKLFNSIKCMQGYKLAKLSARINEDGGVSIDENMVEGEDPSIDPPTEGHVGPATSYATMNCRDRPKFAEEIEKTMNDQRQEEQRQTQGQVGHMTVDNDGFTLVQRREGGGRPKTVTQDHRNVREGNYNIATRKMGTTRHAAREKEPSILKVNERNIRHPNIISEMQGSMGETPAEMGDREMKDTGNVGAVKQAIVNDREKNNVTKRSERQRKPLLSVIETTNKFSLLDESGSIIEDREENNGDVNTNAEIPTTLNAGWVKKQERMLNARFNTSLSQSQRYEAKKYIVDRLTPLQAVLVGWDKPLLEYFRHLCSLHNFGEGLRATAWENDSCEDQEMKGLKENEINMKEVDSKTDPTAIFMKHDHPNISPTPDNLATPINLENAPVGQELTTDDVNVVVS